MVFWQLRTCAWNRVKKSFLVRKKVELALAYCNNRNSGGKIKSSKETATWSPNCLCTSRRICGETLSNNCGRQQERWEPSWPWSRWSNALKFCNTADSFGDAASRICAVGRCKGTANSLNWMTCSLRNFSTAFENESCARNWILTGLFPLGTVRFLNCMAEANNFLACPLFGCSKWVANLYSA